MSDAPALILRRPRAPRALISLVAMIDVLLILLVFFMVTSTYLDLNMIPAAARQEASTSSTSDNPVAASPILIRIGGDGVPTFRGQALDLDELSALLANRVSAAPTLPVMILPTGTARTQALVSVMDVATRAGVRNLRVIRLEARP